MAFEATLFEAIVKEVADAGRAGESDEALADVAGGEDTEFVAELPCAAAIVGHTDEGCDVVEVIFES